MNNNTLKIENKNHPSTLEEALLQLGTIGPSELQLAKIEAQKKKKSLEQLLQEMNLVSPEEIVKAQGLVLDLPYINLQGKKIPQEILNRVPEQVACTYKIVCFSEEDGKFNVALTDPRNLQALEALEFIKEKYDYNIDLYLTSEASIQYALDQYGSLAGEVTEALKEIAPVDLNVDEVVEERVETASELGQIIKEAPISKVVAILIKYAASANASDIHIEPYENLVEIRYRIDGVLQPTLKLPKKIHPALVSRLKILSNLKIDETRLPQDGRFHTIIADKKIDFRVSILPTSNGEKVVLRLLEKSVGLLKMESLGLEGRGFDILKEAIKKPHGMILVCGPTGSGKTTTLYAALQKLNTPGVNIVTLEDPIEYKIEGVNQSQIKPEIGFSFGSGLRSILRQDPDIVMVGEIRDTETAEMAVHAALTGHIVLSTLHTNDASGAIPRLIDMKVEPFLIASSLTTVLSQRLVRKICPRCREKYQFSPKERLEIEEEIKKMPPEIQKSAPLARLNSSQTKEFYKGKGCAFCNQTGFKGRIGIFEVLPITDKMVELILRRAPALEIQELARKEGMISLKQDGILKVLAGITTIDEVLRVTMD